MDAQSSANGGIIIQVIGEMSNRGEPWRKFAQTFFLAEQPNGYFVLNDIFRFLKEESVDADEEDQAHDQADAAVNTQPPSEVVQETAQDPAVPIMKAAYPTATATPDHTPSHGPVPPGKPATPEVHTLEPAPVIVEEKKPTPNGIHHPPSASEPESAPPAPPVPQVESVKPSAEPVPPPVPPPAPPAEAPQPAAPSPPASQPEMSPAPVHAAALTTATVSASVQAPPSAAAAKPASSAPVPSPKPAAPPAPKTWANLAAANSNKWGPQVAQEARGVSAAPPPPPPSAQKPEAHRIGGFDKETRDGGRELHPAHQAALSVATPQCFVKVRT